jgi:hypothetical protein
MLGIRGYFAKLPTSMFKTRSTGLSRHMSVTRCLAAPCKDPYFGPVGISRGIKQIFRLCKSK